MQYGHWRLKQVNKKQNELDPRQKSPRLLALLALFFSLINLVRAFSAAASLLTRSF